MSFNKLESYSNKEVIREEVSILTDLLADITQNILGPETFEKISTMKDLAIDSRYQELKAIVEKLTTDEMVYISRYFSILPLLINISEDVDLAYEINHQNNVNRDYLGKLSTTIDLISTRKCSRNSREPECRASTDGSPNSGSAQDHVGFDQSYPHIVASAP